LRKHRGHEEKPEPRKIKVNAGGPEPAEENEGVKAEEAAEAEVPEAAKPSAPVKDETEALSEKLAELNDKYIRLHAETENFKKRVARENAEMRKYHNEGLIMELLPVVDNLERALSHADENGESGGLVDGVKMVYKQCLDALGKFGVKHIPAEKGSAFDPNMHQAMMQVETYQQEPGTIVDEFQKGYLLNDRVSRATMVTVAKKPG